MTGVGIDRYLMDGPDIFSDEWTETSQIEGMLVLASLGMRQTRLTSKFWTRRDVLPDGKQN
jgi:hypothetical protein